MSEPISGTPPARLASIAEWLRRVNAPVAEWAASMSWWRLVFLFVLILIAGSMVSDQLNLKHERVKAPGRHRPVDVMIGGKDGIRITERGVEKRSGAIAVPPVPPVPGNPASSAPAEPGRADREDGGRADGKDADDNDAKGTAKPRPATKDEGFAAIRIDPEDFEDTVSKRVFTFRGLLGDLGATVMILLFAYLAAAKIVSRKVAQADEKVRSAVDAASKEAMDRQLVQAQLQVLQAQVEPHFLFNTLATVDYLIETDPARASQMQKKLITYLRGALPQMRQESSTLGREMRLIRSYLDLIKMRIEERLEVEINVPDFLDTAEFPPMMLQSLVENAIKHGIEPKPEGGKVSVTARIQRGMLWVEVKDTGVGIVDTEKLQAPTSGGGIGLENIRERLAMLYPGKGRLTLIADDTAGTIVRIGVPFVERDDESEEGAPAPAKA